MSQPVYQELPESSIPQIAQAEAHAFIGDLQGTTRWLAERHTGDLRGLVLDGRIVSQLVLLPLQIGGGRGPIGCGGIGGVVTPPEERRNGYVARLLRETCAEMRERGMPLCMLFPFKRSFYGHFGWAACMDRMRYNGAPELFAPYRKQLHGRFEPVGAEQIDDLQHVYAGALRGRVGPVVRSREWWEKDLLGLPRAPRYAYLWRDEAGAARSYIIYTWERNAAGVTMSCREIVALDPEARGQLFGFIANHDAQCQDVRFHAPADAPVNLLLPNPLECRIKPDFMLRILDVPAALQAQRYPRAVRGRVTLAVQDDWLEHNTGTWALEVADGAATCSRAPHGTPADIACDIRVLMQLFSRYLAPRTAAAFGMLQVNEKPALALLGRMFDGLAPFCSDYF